MIAPGPPFSRIEWDDELERQPAAAEAIAKGALHVERWLQRRAGSVLLNGGILQDMHRVMFEHVFPEFAGKMRGPAPGYLPWQVTFGNYRGVPYDDVPAACETLFDSVANLVRELDTLRINVSANDRQAWIAWSDDVLKVVAYSHCELIRIHPFANGNGLVSRSCINYFAYRFGMLPVPFERPTGEYLDANRNWLLYQRIENMMDVLRPWWRPV